MEAGSSGRRVPFPRGFTIGVGARFLPVLDGIVDQHQIGALTSDGAADACRKDTTVLVCLPHVGCLAVEAQLEWKQVSLGCDDVANFTTPLLREARTVSAVHDELVREFR